MRTGVHGPSRGPARPRTQKTSQRSAAPRVSERRREASGQISAAQRPLLVMLAIILAASGLIARLVFWQVMEHGTLATRVRQQSAELYVQPPMRGQIFDAQGTPLATDVTKTLVYAVPRSIRDPRRSAVELAPVLGMPVDGLESALTGEGTYRQLAPEVSDSVAQQIRNLALPGIVLAPVLRRSYPDGSTAANLLGFVNTDGQGQYGLEGYYNDLLSGKAGVKSVLHDTAGNDIKVTAAAPVPSQDGAELHLTINGTIQALLENDLQKAVRVHRADSGTAIVMDPRTGRVLAMASTPTYDPNQYYRVRNPDQFLNPAVEMQYEPGSTFKIITMAAGLDSGVITPQTSFYDNGTWLVDGIHLHNWNGGGFGIENMTQVLQHSANVGASFVANRLGTARFYDYVHRFMFSRPTGIDLSDELSGQLLHPGDQGWTDVNLFTNSFGQGIAVTPIQMIRAVSAVANGGIMMKPQVVDRVVYRGRIMDRPPVTVGRVISARTAYTLTDMLVHSAIGGEASAGLVKGYDIAAKTGTANIAAPTGGYIPNATIGSIIGYAPAYHPRFVALIVIKHPRDQPWGSVTAAPVLRDLFQELFLLYHIPPNPNALNK